MKRLPACMTALWLWSTVAHADDYLQRINTPFPIPDRYQLVNDYENVLRISHRVALEKRLQALERRNGTQIVFLSVPNTGKEGAWPYAQAVFKKWNIGNNHQGNGILFLVGNDDIAVLTGPGIAGAVPDVVLARIRRNLLLPASQRNELSDGIEQALDVLIGASRGEDTLATAYDYDHPDTALFGDPASAANRRLIVLLSAAAAVYALALLWRRLRARRGGTS